MDSDYLNQPPPEYSQSVHGQSADWVWNIKVQLPPNCAVPHSKSSMQCLVSGQIFNQNTVALLEGLLLHKSHQR